MTQPISPFVNAKAWHKFLLGGSFSPGSITVDGVRGFGLKTGWDVKKGKGQLGATITLVEQPPVEGAFELQLINDQDYQDWIEFIPVMAVAADKQRAKGIDIWYAGFAGLDISAVLIREIPVPRHVGRGRYLVTIEMIQWLPPPPVSIVSTVNTSAPLQLNAPGDEPDPVEDAQQAQISQLLQQAAQP